ncbi:MAG: multidrug efflux system outer membrane protein, partial [Chlamydiales bacterium]
MSQVQLSLASIALMAAGCTMGPDYIRPDTTPIPESFRGQSVSDAGAEHLRTFGDLAWSEAFGDPVLQGLITEGLRANYDLLIAAERVMQARALVT